MMTMGRITFSLLSGLVVLAGFYILILCFPQWFFPYSFSCGNIHLYSPSPIPNNAGDLLTQVQSRLAASQIYKASVEQHIFLCGNSAQFSFFANSSFRSSGLTYAYLNRSIFLRPSDIADNRLFNSSGRNVTDDRTLVYYMAHELTHSLTTSYIGPWKYRRLPAWLKEGYADYVGKGPDSFSDIQAKFEDSAFQTNREYLRYELMTAYLLSIKRVGIRDLFAGNYEANRVTAQKYLDSLR